MAVEHFEPQSRRFTNFRFNSFLFYCDNGGGGGGGGTLEYA